jgi:hypothetical protein
VPSDIAKPIPKKKQRLEPIHIVKYESKQGVGKIYEQNNKGGYTKSE